MHIFHVDIVLFFFSRFFMILVSYLRIFCLIQSQEDLPFFYLSTMGLSSLFSL